METLSAVALSQLIGHYGPKSPGPCRVCGAELKITSMGPEGTVYACSSPEADFLAVGRDERASGVHRGPLEQVASEHYRASQQTLHFHGDARVVTALLELRQLRADAGQDMTVPVGFVDFPLGHGRHRCWQMLKHTGTDQWEQVTDFDFTHDPSHAHLDAPVP